MDENFVCTRLRLFVDANRLFRYEPALSVEKNMQIEISLFSDLLIINFLVNTPNGEFILIIAIIIRII